MKSQVTASGKPRQRSALACNLCRTKRIKCDGQRPICTTCITNGERCEYTSQDSNRKPPSKRYVEALQERIRSLESRLEKYQGADTYKDVEDSSRLEESCDNSEDDSLSDDPNTTHRSPTKDISDRLGALNIGEDGQIHYFGSRSNFSLLKNSPAASSTVSSRELEEQAVRTLDCLGLRVEVSDELRDHLLELFWGWQNTWQYIVVKQPFLDDLLVNHTGQYATPLLLSAVLALASRYSDRVELRSDPLDPNTAGNALAEQAKMILFYESQAPKVTTIQATALLCLREIATDKEALGWLYCGMAARMAFNLGLHLDRTHWCETGHITEQAAEVGATVWWSCYVLDKLFNVGLGRPSTIQENEISAALPSLEHSAEHESWSDQQTSFPKGHIISNVRATIELFRITGSPLDEIYRPSSRRLRAHTRDLVTKTHVELMKFQTNLPSCLRLVPSPLAPTLPHVYQLHLQYHVAIILLHRPFIGVRGHASDPGGFHPREGSTHLVECSQSAQTISTILRLYRKHYTLRRIPISSIHCAFTASIILLLEATSPDPKSKSRAIASLKIVVEALIDMSTAWAWSQRALQAIQKLAREWSVCESALMAVGIDDTAPSVEDTQPGETWDPNTGIPMWTPQGLEGFDLDIPFVGVGGEGLEYEGWIGTLFHEAQFSGGAT
ncbi:hypothetical protein LB507_006814 [Fusarium sp. FIESC RH6]|nr:hypothetical protein LB507_006814 [Fusarium sp. FIESC RH6]